MDDRRVVAAGAPGSDGAVYRICVEGRLDECALGDVADLTLAVVAPPALPEATTLTCRLPDQQALVGLINRLHSSGLALVLIERL